MKYFPKRLNMTWVKNCYSDGSLTPYELIEEIIKRAEDTKEKNIWIVPPDMKFIKSYIDNIMKKEVNSLPL